ncbi:HNH endonuclease [Synechococcus phage Yong-M3-232]|nr:HNH endonuclease [Synechococcus phage Yong-M3-232]
MTLTLRPYQERCLADLWHWFERDFALPKPSILLRNSGREGATNTRPALNIQPVVEAAMSDRPDTGNPSATQEIISRAEAKARGLVRYYTGKACKYGHVAQRWTASAKCLECHESQKASGALVEGRRRYREANKERINRNLRKWQAENAEEISRRRSARYAERVDEMRARNRRNYEKNPELFKASARNRKARLRAAEGRHTAADIAAIYEAQKGRCAYCKASLKNARHVDHIVPLAKGGSNWPSNLQLLCPPCNMAKRDKDPVAFAQKRGFLL